MGQDHPTIPQFILAAARRQHPEHPALVGAGRHYTYRELLDRVENLAGEIARRGGQPGDRIALLSENCPEWGLAYLAILHAGRVVVPIDPALGAGELLHILRESEATGIFLAPDRADQLAGIRARLKALAWSRELGDAVAAARDGRGPGEPRRDHTAYSLAVLIFTSGTTGSSKAVMLTHRNLVANVEAIAQVVPLTPADRVVSLIPLFHTFEATCGFLLPLSRGAGIHYPSGPSPSELIATMKKARVTFIAGVPLLYEKFLLGVRRRMDDAPLPRRLLGRALLGLGAVVAPWRKPLLARLRRELGWEHLQFVISGGAAMPAGIARGLERLGVPLLQGYGLTEAAPVVAVNPPGKAKNRTVGRPLPGVDVRIAEPDGAGIGEILVRGANVMTGYYHNPDATAAVIRDGWLHTGDLGFLDRDGYLVITGRSKSIIVTATGKNIYPEELEALLLARPLVKEVLVVPRLDPNTKREEICAIIHPDYERLEREAATAGIEPSANEINARCHAEVRKVNAALPIYKRVTRFELREEEFPKTPTRKIKRHLFLPRGHRVN